MQKTGRLEWSPWYPYTVAKQANWPLPLTSINEKNGVLVYGDVQGHQERSEHKYSFLTM